MTVAVTQVYTLVICDLPSQLLASKVNEETGRESLKLRSCDAILIGVIRLTTAGKKVVKLGVVIWSHCLMMEVSGPNCDHKSRTTCVD